MYSDMKTGSAMGNMAEAQLGLLRVPQVRAPGQQGQVASLKDAAHEFEAYFISHLLKVMRETVPKGALENKGAYGEFAICSLGSETAVWPYS